MKKTLLLPLIPFVLSGCGLIKDLANIHKSSNEFIITYEEGKPNSFGECNKLTIRAKNERTGDLIIKRKGAQDTGTAELIIHKKDIQGQQVYVTPNTERHTDLTIICDDRVNEAHQFNFSYYSYAPTIRAVLYNTSTMPNWEEWIKPNSRYLTVDKNGLKSFILIGHR